MFIAKRSKVFHIAVIWQVSANVVFVCQLTLSQMSLSNGGSSTILHHIVPSDEVERLQGRTSWKLIILGSLSYCIRK